MIKVLNGRECGRGWKCVANQVFEILFRQLILSLVRDTLAPGTISSSSSSLLWVLLSLLSPLLLSDVSPSSTEGVAIFQNPPSNKWILSSGDSILASTDNYTWYFRSLIPSIPWGFSISNDSTHSFPNRLHSSVTMASLYPSNRMSNPGMYWRGSLLISNWGTWEGRTSITKEKNRSLRSHVTCTKSHMICITNHMTS